MKLSLKVLRVQGMGFFFSNLGFDFLGFLVCTIVTLMKINIC